MGTIVAGPQPPDGSGPVARAGSGRAATASDWLQLRRLQWRPMSFLTPRRLPTARTAAAARTADPQPVLPRLRLSVDGLLLLAAAWLAAVPNRPFVSAALSGRSGADPTAWGLGAALVLGVLALHLILLVPLASRATVKPLLALLVVLSAVASYYMQQFGVVIDPTMLRNVLRSDWHEARELLGASLAWHLLLQAGLPLLVLSRVQLRPRPWLPTLGRRLLLLAAAFGLLVGLVLAAYQPLSSLMRSHKALRYQITPANLLWSLASVATADVQARSVPRRAIGLDAQPGPSWAASGRPRLVVLVVGETARAANWGLSGYARQTTPQLAQLPVINVVHAGSCGTDTETSVPCLFAPVGRRDYDEAGIRGSESLLHLLARAGVGVTWRDNQSGCKGVCAGLPTQTVQELAPPGLCADGRCLDEGLLAGLPELLRQARGTQLLVLHQLGNHGPSYFRRYPPAFARFQPECRNDDLRLCSREQIVNAYDNALRYTDHVLAQLITQLQAQAQTLDSALVYVSDHGESLGENNLYLHGLPYVIAPDVQKQVPLVMWFSPGFASQQSLDLGCLRSRAATPAAHDHVFHTLLGLLDVRTALYEPAWDLGQPCRRPAA
jgi:lipid A ethanolaminephosphotransferase